MGPVQRIQELPRSRMKYFRWLALVFICVGDSGCQAGRVGGLSLYQDGNAKYPSSGKRSKCDGECDWQQECKVPLFHETRWRTLGSAMDD